MTFNYPGMWLVTTTSVPSFSSCKASSAARAFINGREDESFPVTPKAASLSDSIATFGEALSWSSKTCSDTKIASSSHSD